MHKYNNMLEMLEDRLRNGERFGLRMNLEGEGKFKDFEGKNAIPALRKFIENIDDIENLTIRYENAEEDIISEY